MSYIIKVKDVPVNALKNAAVHVRKKYKLSADRILCKEFEDEFDVKYSTDNIYDIEFRSESDYLFFVLQWS